MTIFSTTLEQKTMTMQKSCQNGQQLRQQQYVRPDSPAPSSVKKSPLAMLVDACSNIGQELNKTKSSDITSQFDARKQRSTTSPLSNGGSKPNSPPPPYSQRVLSAPAASARAKVEAQANKEQLSVAASLASQYQLMYQQLLYQSELEYLQKSKGASAAPIALSKASQEMGKAATCNLCRMNPGYKGYCVHENHNSLNQMLAMLNPGSAAAAMLAYSNKLASFQQPYLDSQISAIYPKNAESPSTNQSVDSRRTSASSITSTSPRRHESPCQTNPEQPMDLKIEKSKSPTAGITQLIECHWVGAEGYCGKRFHSQDDLMQHLKHHVATCPNVVVSNEENRPSAGSRQQATRLSPTDRSTQKHRSPTGPNLLTVEGKHPSARFQPYSVSDRMYPSALILGTPR